MSIFKDKISEEYTKENKEYTKINLGKKDINEDDNIGVMGIRTFSSSSSSAGTFFANTDNTSDAVIQETENEGIEYKPSV